MDIEKKVKNKILNLELESINEIYLTKIIEIDQIINKLNENKLQIEIEIRKKNILISDYHKHRKKILNFNNL